MTERLWMVVGPSGAGKDSTIAELAARLRPEDGIVIARRTITRPVQLGAAEQHSAVTPEAFARQRADGAFILDWESHGLSYGIGVEVRAWLTVGLHVVANGSRAALPAARAALGPTLCVVEVTAPPAVLAARLATRGRESSEEIAGRLVRTAELTRAPADLTIVNDGTLEAAVTQLHTTLLGEAAPCDVKRPLIARHPSRQGCMLCPRRSSCGLTVQAIATDKPISKERLPC